MNWHLSKYRSKRDIYKTVFDTPMGDRVIKDLAEYCGLYRSSMSMTPEMTAFNEGKRDVFNRIMSFLHIDHTNYFIQLGKELDMANSMNGLFNQEDK